MCRIELSQDSMSTTSAFTLGEQAHIVGEKVDAARGKSLLSDQQRDSYHNRILLCPTHHTEIDQNADDWPNEKLHYVKSVHELWVRETLADSADAQRVARQIVVTSIIDSAVSLCDLENWKSWASNALAPDPTWPADSPENIFEFRQRVASAIWPEDAGELRRATETLAVSLHLAVVKYREHSRFERDRFWPHKFYKGNGFNPNYDKDLEKYEGWLSECWNAVKTATKAANWFADVVRRDVNPMFFAERGKFMVIEGPFSDFSITALIPEFSTNEKLDLPEILYRVEA